MAVRRLHLFHSWSRWADAEATFDSPLFPRLGSWRGPVQVRVCERCGRKQIRSL